MTANIQSKPTSRNLLENLVVRQIEELISGEKLIQQQYAQLRGVNGSSERSALLVSQMADLQRRADRLNRMLDVMPVAPKRVTSSVRRSPRLV